jgi:hypothetical protein
MTDEKNRSPPPYMAVAVFGFVFFLFFRNVRIVKNLSNGVLFHSL